MKRAILRYEIPVDGRWHRIPVGGYLCHVGTRHEDRVEAWIEVADPPSDLDPGFRDLRVFGTGHPIPEGSWDPESEHPQEIYDHVGTAITPSGDFVWHLIERTVESPI